MSKPRVSYYYDEDTGLFSYGLGHPMKPYRMRMTHNLVAAYGMLSKMSTLRPRRSTPEEMTSFHTDEYIDFLTKVTPETVEELTLNGTRFLMREDNPAFDGVFEFCSISAGGSVCAAHRLNKGEADIAINWAGGLHHAKKREASGFCYINDIVLAILELLRIFPRVLYIDIDCHHGDGVEEAFYTTDRVLTCSFHKFGDYFPGTGHVDDRGYGKGFGYSVNVPLRDGLTDEGFKGVFEPVIQRILDWYRPSAIILQLGADSLAGDKLGCFNVTMEGHAESVKFLRNKGIPLIMLGGGGYTVRNVARTWTYETACALGMEDDIDRNLPYNDYFEWFGPRYRLEVLKNNMEDVNQKDGYIEGIKQEVLKHLEDLPHAPSVAMQNVPGEGLAEHLGYTTHEEEDLSELDEQVADYVRRAHQSRDTSPSESDEGVPTPLNDPYAHNNPFYAREEAYYSSDSEASGRGRTRRKTRQSFMMPNYHNPNAPSIFQTHQPAKKSNASRRKFFSSNLVWDVNRREVVQIQSGQRWRTGTFNLNNISQNKLEVDEEKEAPIVNGDEEAIIDDADDVEMEEPDVDGLEEDGVEESLLMNDDGYRTRQSTSRAESIMR